MIPGLRTAVCPAGDLAAAVDPFDHRFGIIEYPDFDPGGVK